MFKIGVCDDDPLELNRMSELLKQYQSNKDQTIVFDVFHHANDLLESMKSNSYDLLFLDILMPGLNGIETAKEIRLQNKEVIIIFLTSSPEYALDSYSVNAYTYLIKPGTKQTLYLMLDKILLSSQKEEEALMLVYPTAVVRIPLSHISYLEICNKKLLFHLEDNTIREISGTLSTYEKKLLLQPAFIKVHRSYIVNMNYIKELNQKELLTISGQTIPVSRLIYSEVRKRYMDYLFMESGIEK